MPAFQAPVSSKRKLDAQHSTISAKRVAIDPSRNDEDEEHWIVQWRNPQTKKHKTWDGDAVLVAGRSKSTLYDMDGQIITNGKVQWPLHTDKSFSFSGKDIQLDRRISRSEYISGQALGTTSVESCTVDHGSLSVKQFVPPKIKPQGVAVQPQSVAPRTSLRPCDTSSAINNLPLETHWTANWRKPQTKKHRTWDGDAYVSHLGAKLIMISEEGTYMGSSKWKGDSLGPGYLTHISGKEVQLDSQVDKSKLPVITGSSGDIDEASMQKFREIQHTMLGQKTSPVATPSKFISPALFYAATPKTKTRVPLHDPEAEGAVVMKAPTAEHIKRFNKKDSPVIPVVLDPILARKMRPHQHDGVKFMYESVMGMRRHEGQGCILADDMGLGKSLQTIALVWTLLKQNPYASPNSIVQKVLIVCPVSLVNNWKAEFHKWLGKDRLGVATCDKDKKTALMFMNAKNQHVLIIGYERLRTVINQLGAMVPPIGIIICDEGHRLKSANNKTNQMFAALRTKRRIILSGTPIQNDLGEFHAMADFCNPGLLDEYGTFRRVYEIPILKSRSTDASAKDLELGETRTAQLLSVARSFVLRREANILQDLLPPKHEYVVFVAPTTLQLAIFSMILQPETVDDLVQSSTAESLALINILTKVSNSPVLLKATVDQAKENSESTLQRVCISDVLCLLPDNTEIEDVSLSGKLTALAKLLKLIYTITEEKCVLVSHYTSTLNILEAFCRKEHYSYHRLDGRTPASKRQELVTTFNKSSKKQSFIFLLSSKAGGVGINLIGASRLCLIDSDWNPSHDIQSMARCHRDGQKRPVYIYRFLTAGTIDEKIYQRQVTKLGLSNSLIGSSIAGSKVDSFSRKDLRDIFRVDPHTTCNTHDLLECPCETTFWPLPTDDFSTESEDNQPQKGFVKACEIKPGAIEKMDRAYVQKKKEGLAALGEWKHINCLRPTARDEIQDDLLQKLIDLRETGANDDLPTSSSQCNSYASNAIENMTARTVLGGSITFLFEKITTININDSNEAD